MFPRTIRTLLFLAISLVLATSSASAYDLFEIHTAGPFAGEIRINGEFVVKPDGACGIEWNDVVAWHWGPSAGSPVQSGFGGTLWYTVGYSTCADSGAPYSFVTPATPTGHPANNVLVVQADVEDAVWLNWALDAIPGPEIGPDHDWPSICEQVPEFCEPASNDFTIPDPCDVNPDNCGVNIAQLDLPLAIHLGRSTGREIANILELMEDSTRSTREIDASIAEALRRLDNTRLALRDVRILAEDLRLDPQVTSEVFVATASTFVAATRFASDALDESRNLVADLTASSKPLEVQAALDSVRNALRLLDTASTGASQGATFGSLAAAPSQTTASQK